MCERERALNRSVPALRFISHRPHYLVESVVLYTYASICEASARGGAGEVDATSWSHSELIASSSEGYDSSKARTSARLPKVHA